MQRTRRICLVSPSHVAANPRLVKEADALQAAGFSVHVIAGWYYPPLDRFDLEIYAKAKWSRSIVYYLTGPRVFTHKLRNRIARRRLANAAKPSLSLATKACHPAIALLSEAAMKVEADLYIGHTLAGLPAAGSAARARKKLLGFDAEDFHRAETESLAGGGPASTAISIIESAWIPKCAHFTASAPLIARAYAETYRTEAPRTVLNVFPREEAPRAPVAGAESGTPRLYWFSQTIGPGRGLEYLIAALGKMRTRCDLHLRGTPAADFLPRFRQLAIGCGFAGKIDIQPIASAGEMSRLASSYDLGLSLEQTWPPNRDYCLTNKIFTYLLAGIPVALTPTSAQKALAAELGEAALLIDFDDPARTAGQLDDFFNDPQRCQRARQAAWKCGQGRFNWDIEKTTLLESVEAAFSQNGRPFAPA